jgi:hypothetical protein
MNFSASWASQRDLPLLYFGYSEFIQPRMTRMGADEEMICYPWNPADPLRQNKYRDGAVNLGSGFRIAGRFSL